MKHPKMNVIAVVLIAMVVASCATQKYNVTYDFPPAMSDFVRSEYIKQWNTGKVLYELNCAKCHNTTVGKHSIVPDFAPEKLVGYTLRVTNPKHEANIEETTVSTEELGLIMTFLNYKTKNRPASGH